MDSNTQSIEERFTRFFGNQPSMTESAPGRVNLIGEHTDYNGGFVLPTIISQRTQMVIGPRLDRSVHLYSDCVEIEQRSQCYEIGQESPCGKWTDYIQGGTSLLTKKGFQLSGFNLRISSDIPLGAGLSSSAALLVAFFRVMRSHFKLELRDEDIATLSQEVENNFVGANVGIMDQMASSLGKQDAALFIDTRSLVFESIPLPMERMDIFVINSGIKHSHSTGGYNARRRECEEACRQLGIASLRDVSSVSVLAKLEPLLLKRARHVVTENQRVLEAVARIREGNLEELGRLMVSSHLSMKEDYEVSIREIDFLVELALAQSKVYGARLTGGGFGGAIVGICEKGEANTVMHAVAERYKSSTGRDVTLIRP